MDEIQETITRYLARQTERSDMISMHVTACSTKPDAVPSDEHSPTPTARSPRAESRLLHSMSLKLKPGVTQGDWKCYHRRRLPNMA